MFAFEKPLTSNAFRKDKGGISITNTVPLTHIDADEIRAVMGEYKISSADIAIRCDATIDDFIDVIEAKSRSYIPVIYALNKIDAISIEELDLLYRIPNACPISSEQGWNVDELMEQMSVPCLSDFGTKSVPIPFLSSLVALLFMSRA